MLNQWLEANGWNDVFLDLDPERGIAAGERWETVFYEVANRCEAVLFLISKSRLDSQWCLKDSSEVSVERNDPSGSFFAGYVSQMNFSTQLTISICHHFPGQ